MSESPHDQPRRSPEHDPDLSSGALSEHLHLLASDLDRSGRMYEDERAGLSDRVYANSVLELRAAHATRHTAGSIGHSRWSIGLRQWSAVAAVLVFGASVAVYVVGNVFPPVSGNLIKARAGNSLSARATELAPMSGSEALLVALIDEDAALKSTDGGNGFDASAIMFSNGRSVDEVTVELEELLATGAGR